MIGARPLQRGLASLAAWWLKEMHASMPDALRRLGEPPQPMRMIVRADDNEVLVSLANPSGEEVFSERLDRHGYTRTLLDRCFAKAAAYGRRRDIALTLCVPQALTRSLIIPRRARSSAHAIVREHIRRKTPLSLDDIFVGLDLRPAGEGKLELRYLVLPKAVLERELAFLQIAPSDLAGLQGRAVASERPVAVAFPEEPARRRPRAMWAVLILLSLSVLGLAAGSAATFWKQHELIADFEQKLSGVAAPAGPSQERSKSVEILAHELRTFEALRAAPGVVQVWEELARVLPTSTYLTDVDIKGFDVHLTGFAESAADLIQMIERSPILHNASFTGRVAFDKAKGKEQFALRASLRASRLPAEERE